MIAAFLEATVKEALRRRANAIADGKGFAARLAIGIHSHTAPEAREVQGMRVAWCRSMLEMREQMTAPDPGKLVIVTPIQQHELADDITARLHSHKLVPVDVRQMLKHMYEAREVDFRVSGDPVL